MSPTSAQPRDVDDRELPSLIHRSAGPLVVESHHAGWASPWHALPGGAWEELAREFGRRIGVARVETGRNREFAARYGLEIIPAVLIFSAGEVVARFSGQVRLDEVIEALRDALRRVA